MESLIFAIVMICCVAFGGVALDRAFDATRRAGYRAGYRDGMRDAYASPPIIDNGPAHIIEPDENGLYPMVPVGPPVQSE
jgi:hypothetical protein